MIISRRITAVQVRLACRTIATLTTRPPSLRVCPVLNERISPAPLFQTKIRFYSSSISLRFETVTKNLDARCGLLAATSLSHITLCLGNCVIPDAVACHLRVGLCAGPSARCDLASANAPSPGNAALDHDGRRCCRGIPAPKC